MFLCCDWVFGSGSKTTKRRYFRGRLSRRLGRGSPDSCPPSRRAAVPPPCRGPSADRRRRALDEGCHSSSSPSTAAQIRRIRLARLQLQPVIRRLGHYQRPWFQDMCCRYAQICQNSSGNHLARAGVGRRSARSLDRPAPCGAGGMTNSTYPRVKLKEWGPAVCNAGRCTCAGPPQYGRVPGLSLRSADRRESLGSQVVVKGCPRLGGPERYVRALSCPRRRVEWTVDALMSMQGEETAKRAAIDRQSEIVPEG